jgi:hypothetical protein
MPAPPVSTRPSGSSVALEWYWRTRLALDKTVQVSVAGSHRSAADTGLSRSVSSSIERLLVHGSSSRCASRRYASHDAVHRSVFVVAGHQQSAIGELDVSSAEDVVALNIPANISVVGRVPNHGPGVGMVRGLRRRFLARWCSKWLPIGSAIFVQQTAGKKFRLPNRLQSAHSLLTQTS